MKHTYVIILSTFLFGVVSGVILFLYNNVGKDDTVSSHPPASIVGAETLSISAYRYGGCARGGGCTSYRIVDGGELTYILRSRNEGESRSEDTLEAGEFAVLLELLSETDLETVENSEFVGNCPAEYDGTAYQYDITYEGREYHFDTCVQSLSDEELFSTLEDYFALFNARYVE